MSKARARGFTVIELMVTLAVAAIVISMAVPSFQSVVNGNKLAAGANELMASLQAARMEAIRRGQRAGVCFSTKTNSGVDATCSNANVDGWIAFVDANGDGDFDKAGDTLIRVSTLGAGVVVSANPALGGVVVGKPIIFRPDGLARDEPGGGGPGTGLLDAVVRLCIATTRPAANARDVEIASGSRVAITNFDGGGACAAPGNP